MSLSSNSRDEQAMDSMTLPLALLALAATGDASSAATQVKDAAPRDCDQSTIVSRCLACSRWYAAVTARLYCAFAIYGGYKSTYDIIVTHCVLTHCSSLNPPPNVYVNCPTLNVYIHCSHCRRKTTPYQVRRSILDSLIRSHLSAEEVFEACEHLVGIDHSKGDHEALATLRHHQRPLSLKAMCMKPPSTKRLGTPEHNSSKRPAIEGCTSDATDGIHFCYDDVRHFYAAMRSSALFIPLHSSAIEQDASTHSVWLDVKKKNAKLTKEEKERDRSVKKDNILKSLASQHLTEKEILRDVGDSRYTREVLRKLLAEAKIYRVGKGYEQHL